MKDKYYKIGEFSKLSGVSIKALRYYDEIGVLKPAYIDEQTNYRYYVPEQMIVLDVMKLCKTFNLPLKKLNCQQSPINFKNMIIEGKLLAKEQLNKTLQLLRVSDDILEQITRLEKVRKPKEIYKTLFHKRKILVSPWSDQNTSKDYINKIANLHKIAQDNNLTVLTQQGLFMDCNNNSTYVFLSVQGEVKSTNSFQFNNMEYSCMILEEELIGDVKNILNNLGLIPKYIFCMNTDMYDFCLSHPLHMLEVQCIE